MKYKIHKLSFSLILIFAIGFSITIELKSSSDDSTNYELVKIAHAMLENDPPTG